MSNNNHLLARLVTEMISQEFIEQGMYGVCLPAGLIMFELLQTFEPELKCGMMMFDNVLPVPIHIWCEMEGVKYDPTHKMALHHLTEAEKSSLMGKNYEYFPGKEIMSCAEDQEMLNFYNMMKNTKNVEGYFEAAPYILKNISNSANLSASKLFQ